MQLQIYHALWGMEGTLREKFERAHAHGYDGIESIMPSAEERSEFVELLDEFKLAYIAQIFPSQKEEFEELVVTAKSLSPVLINAHSGKDFMNEEEQNLFFEHALKVEREAGVQVGHETHRGRILFTPAATARLLKLFPELKITADFSHFTCVCESLLGDQKEAVELAISRAIHVHGRVGFEEGPQVPHPAAPEYAGYVEKFEQWWDAMLNNGLTPSGGPATFTPEFGPPGYMPRIPFANEPVADLFEVNQWIAKRIIDRYRVKA